MAVNSPRSGKKQKPHPPLYWTNEAEHRRKLAEAFRDIGLDAQYIAVAAGLEGKPAAGQKIIVDFIPPLDMQLPQDLTGSYARVSANPSMLQIFTINKNGAQIGDVKVNTGGTISMSYVATTDFTAGESYLTVFSPSPADATLSDFSVTLLFTRLE